MNEFITTDADLIFEEVITSLESYVSEPLYPGDERRIFGEALVPLFVAMYNAMNDAARQNMLAAKFSTHWASAWASKDWLRRKRRPCCASL